MATDTDDMLRTVEAHFGKRHGSVRVLRDVYAIVNSIPAAADKHLRYRICARVVNILATLAVVWKMENSLRVNSTKNMRLADMPVWSGETISPVWLERLKWMEHTLTSGLMSSASGKHDDGDMSDDDFDIDDCDASDYPLPVPKRLYRFGKALSLPKDVRVTACACVIFVVCEHGSQIYNTLDSDIYSMLGYGTEEIKKVRQVIKSVQVRVAPRITSEHHIMDQFESVIIVLCFRLRLVPPHMPEMVCTIAKDIITNVYLHGKSPANVILASFVVAHEDLGIVFTDDAFSGVAKALLLRTGRKAAQEHAGEYRKRVRQANAAVTSSSSSSSSSL